MKHLRAILLCLIPATGTTSVGCSEALLPTNVQVAEASNQQGYFAGDETISHDFGVVAPHSIHTHTFTISNPGPLVLEIESVTSGCSCTVADIPSEELAPGDSIPVSITFTAPDEIGDLSRSVRIGFRDSRRKPIILEIVAHIRSPLTILPRRVVLQCTPSEGVLRTSVHAENYDSRAWDGIRVVEIPSWLSVEIAALPAPESRTNPSERFYSRQKWRLDMAIDASKLSIGTHEGFITLQSDGNTRLNDMCSVIVSVVPPARITPKEFFFRETPVGGLEVDELRVVLAGNLSLPSKPEMSIAISDGLARHFKCSAKSIGQRVWLVRGVFEPKESELTLNGTVELSFSNSCIPSITVPVHARSSSGIATR
jgi:hypothetical protein